MYRWTFTSMPQNPLLANPLFPELGTTFSEFGRAVDKGLPSCLTESLAPSTGDQASSETGYCSVAWKARF